MISKSAIPALLLCLMWSARSDAGPLYVEDADIAQPGTCTAKSWASFAGRHGFLGVVTAKCAADIGRPVEFEVELERERARREWSTEIAIEAKTALWKHNDAALAVQWGAAFDLTAGGLESLFARTPLSIELNNRLQLNFNIGWRYEREEQLHWATYGAGFEFKLAAPLVLVGEMFGQAGQRSPEEPHASKVRTQLGLRYSPAEEFRIDLLYGHNITGSGGNWITLGVTFRPTDRIQALAFRN